MAQQLFDIQANKLNLLKPVLVIIMADNCTACKKFKSMLWSTLKQKIIFSNLVNIVEINLPAMNAKLSPEYPKDLQKYSVWWPTFILFTGASWKLSTAYAEQPLEGVIFNGRINNGVAEHYQDVPGAKQYELAYLPQWIDDQLKTPLFSQYKTKGPLLLLTDNGVPIKSGDNKTTTEIKNGTKKVEPRGGRTIKYKLRSNR